MKTIQKMSISLALVIAAMQLTLAQVPQSGRITYEGMRKLDSSQLRIVINGEIVPAGSADAPNIPDVTTFAQQLIFAGKYAREEREAPNTVIRRINNGAAGPEQTTRIEPPVRELNYIDIANQKYVRVLEVKKDSAIQRYQAEIPFSQSSGWQDTGKTKKVAGYTCRKATCSWKGENYTIWYTTELPFTYSPITELTPAKGVVLQVEASGESFKAIRIEAKAVAEKEVQPDENAQKVSPAQLGEMRKKALADFRQKMFSAPFPGR